MKPQVVFRDNPIGLSGKKRFGIYKIGKKKILGFFADVNFFNTNFDLLGIVKKTKLKCSQFLSFTFTLQVISDSMFIMWIISSIKLHSKISKHPIYAYKMTVDTQLNLTKQNGQTNQPGKTNFVDIVFFTSRNSLR